MYLNVRLDLDLRKFNLYGYRLDPAILEIRGITVLSVRSENPYRKTKLTLCCRSANREGRTQNTQEDKAQPRCNAIEDRERNCC